ncbi:hypothetical protein FACS1894199_09390 [Bacteroidia bacterium]|nr:hypothetical protein FACS1894199_09390 [Bacteroidia bacterium]
MVNYNLKIVNKATALLLLLFLFVAFVAKAQSAHELSFHVGGGISTLNYSPPSLSPPLGLDYGLGINHGFDYTFFFTPHWGISTGLSAAYFNGKYECDSIGIYSTKDNILYTETHQLMLLNIPLMLHFETGKFYTALGGKIGFPLIATYKNELSPKKNSNVPKQSGSGELELKPVFFASAEVGMKWPLSRNTSLYTGVYFDYGLNDIIKKDIIDDLIKATTPLSTGLKVAVAFGKPSAKKTIEPEETTDLNSIPEPLRDTVTITVVKYDTVQIYTRDTVFQVLEVEDPNTVKGEIDHLRQEIQKMRDNMDVEEAFDRLVKKTGVGHYHLVVGSFQDKENAVELAEMFIQRGFDEANLRIDKNKGWYRVVILSFKTFRPANNKKNELKDSGNPIYEDMWILRE